MPTVSGKLSDEQWLKDALSIVKPAVLGLILCVAAVVFFEKKK